MILNDKLDTVTDLFRPLINRNITATKVSTTYSPKEKAEYYKAKYGLSHGIGKRKKKKKR